MNDNHLKHCMIPGCNKELPEGTKLPICDYHAGEAKELVGKVVTGAFAIGGTVLLIFKDVPSLVAGVAKNITNKKL